MFFDHLRCAAVAGSVLALSSCSAGGGLFGAGGPSVELAGDGFTYTVTVTDGKPIAESTYMGSAPAGTRYWGVTVEIDVSGHADEGALSPPTLLTAVPAGQTAVTPHGRGGMFNLPTAGSCTLDGVPGVLSGTGNNGLGSAETAGVPDGLCLFTLLYDSGADSGSMTYVSNYGFTGDGLDDPLYFVAAGNALGQSRGGWIELKS